jgi:hypothetical protein
MPTAKILTAFAETDPARIASMKLAHRAIASYRISATEPSSVPITGMIMMYRLEARIRRIIRRAPSVGHAS